jgi:dipeptidyl aminopeptidase/acylaminoacyl peptidase
MKEILVKSSVDGSLQPSLFHSAKSAGRPLLVGLHTWSYGRDNQINNMLPPSVEQDFNLLLPEFRGSNMPNNPNCRDACGSEKAITDILDAVEFVCENYDIDKSNRLLLGLSGGGHMALLTAAKAPRLFRAVGAFVPVIDLARWHRECDGVRNYRECIEACLGGTVDEVGIDEYNARSPIGHIDEIAKANVKIFHGKYDTTVSFRQSLDFYNELLLRNPDSRVYLDIFDGGHEINIQVAFDWFFSQMNGVKLTAVTG